MGQTGTTPRRGVTGLLLGVVRGVHGGVKVCNLIGRRLPRHLGVRGWRRAVTQQQRGARHVGAKRRVLDAGYGEVHAGSRRRTWPSIHTRTRIRS